MELKEIATMRAVAMLKASKCTFIIVKENGEVIIEGDLKLAEPEAPRKQRVPVKTYWNVYHPMIKDLKPGESAVIPYGELDSEGLQSSVSAWCSTNWGKGATITHRTDAVLEILRVA